MFKEYIDKGIELLDTKTPGWRKDINLAELNMVNTNFCVLGQLYDEYLSGCYNLEIQGEMYGFDLPLELTEDESIEIDAHVLYEQLTDEWKEAIRQ